MLALVDWPAEAVAAQELIARAAAEAAEAAATANDDAPPDLEAAPTVHAPPSRKGTPLCMPMTLSPCCRSSVLISCQTPSLAYLDILLPFLAVCASAIARNSQAAGPLTSCWT